MSRVAVRAAGGKPAAAIRLRERLSDLDPGTECPGPAASIPMADEDREKGADMAEQDDAGQDHAAVDPGQGVRTEPEVSSPELDHLQHTIDDARDAAKQALSDQPDV